MVLASNMSGFNPVAASLTFNKVSQNGKQSVFRPSPGEIAAADLADITFSVAHSATQRGRTRSVIRADVTVKTATDVSKTASVYLVLDQESLVSDEAEVAFSTAFCLLGKLITDASTAKKFSATFGEVVNGES